MNRAFIMEVGGHSWGKSIELYIRTRGRTGDAACTSAMGPQDDKRAILYAR